MKLKLTQCVLAVLAAANFGGIAAERPAAATTNPPASDQVICARALVSNGDSARLQRVLAKARRGEAITVGVIGGSITQGASVSKPEFRYGNRVAAW